MLHAMRADTVSAQSRRPAAIEVCPITRQANTESAIAKIFDSLGTLGSAQALRQFCHFSGTNAPGSHDRFR